MNNLENIALNKPSVDVFNTLHPRDDLVSSDDILEQCRAIVFAISELVDSKVRDALNWVLMDRLELLQAKLAEESLNLDEGVMAE